jgi:Met-zincin/Domain of unknown function (DUF5117)
MANAKTRFRLATFVAGCAAAGLMCSVAAAQTKTATRTAPAATAPLHAKILDGFKKVVSTADGKKPMWTIYTREKDSQMVAELPANFASQKYFIGLTVSSGEIFAGLQNRDMYVYWRKFNDRLALMEPNVDTRSTGDAESKSSVARLFTDKVLLDVPILTTGPGGGPLIDMDALLVGKASVFFGPRYTNSRFSRLYDIKKAKAFPQNVELAFEFPTLTGQLQTLHYSISVLPENTGYKPRLADTRVGYFTTTYKDLGKYRSDETNTRYINRWHIEKADPSLKISPPKEPIVFYIEHTTPIRYRRWVEEGILSWNPAFEKIGIHNALKVEFQDAKTGAFMDLDPEDVRYNFIRWLNNNIGTAIGPSRTHPMTGQILDADIILTDGWIRHYNFQFNDILPKIAMEGFDPETLAWLAKHPDWDPRLRLAAPAQRDTLRRKILRESLSQFAGNSPSRKDDISLGGELRDGLVGRNLQLNGRCDAAAGLAFEMALMRMHLATQDDADDAQVADKKSGKGGKKPGKKPKKPTGLIDGMPEEFVGPLLAHLVSHEVGHTLGLRHNFKGSSLHTLAEINSAAMKGKPMGGSVMDYTPVNINMKGGTVQGDYAMKGIGPYDYWAIEYGYTFAKDLKPILSRVAEPGLQYGTDEDALGPDPYVRRYDFSKNPLDYAQDQMRLAKYHRRRLVKKFVKDGQSWDRARTGYELTLSVQTRAIGMMANWIGGSHVYRDKKGDKNGRPPIDVVSAAEQKAALKFVIENTFDDKAFGLNTDLLRHMTVDKWMDGNNYIQLLRTDSAWPVHDKIMGIQASVLTMLMKPTTLRRVYDNEFRVAENQDALTLPDLMASIRNSIWSELDKKPSGKNTARKPMISSLRRNLQREHLKRLIDLTMPNAVNNESGKPIGNLARQELRIIKAKAEAALKRGGLDPYSLAHVTEVKEQAEKALDARYIYNSRRSAALPQILRIGNDPGGMPSAP